MQPMPDDAFFAQRRVPSRGCMERDRRLALAVVLRLGNDVRTRREGVRVAAQNGVVLLSGTAGSWAARRTAGAVAGGTPGALDVCNALCVDPDAPDRRPSDPFAELVASVGEPSRPRVLSGAWLRVVRPGPVLAALLLLVWLSWPISACTGLTAWPFVVADSAVTVIAVSVRAARRLRHPPSLWP